MKKGIGFAPSWRLSPRWRPLVRRARIASCRRPRRGLSCKSTLKLAIVTPLTGGAGFLGQEQLTWAKLAVSHARTPDSG